MANRYIPRQLVHLWSEAIGNDSAAHMASINRLMGEQRRLLHFIQENAESADKQTLGAANYYVGVIARMFELAGGRLRTATWEQVRSAERRIGEVVPSLLPYDAGFADRVRAVEWRAQPHILDEALMALFSGPAAEKTGWKEEDGVKIFFFSWLATEVFDGNWTPPKDFAGETTYEYSHIEPAPPPDAEAEAT